MRIKIRLKSHHNYIFQYLLKGIIKHGNLSWNFLVWITFTSYLLEVYHKVELFKFYTKKK